jgi:hypothetical protein
MELTPAVCPLQWPGRRSWTWRLEKREEVFKGVDGMMELRVGSLEKL